MSIPRAAKLLVDSIPPSRIMRVGRNLISIATAADTSEHDLMAITIRGGVLNGKNGFRIHAWGKFGTGAGIKTLKFYIDGVSITILSETTSNAEWSVTLQFFSTGINTQQYIMDFAKEASMGQIFTGVKNVNDAVDFICKFTGQNSLAVSAFTQEGMTVDYVANESN